MEFDVTDISKIDEIQDDDLREEVLMYHSVMQWNVSNVADVNVTTKEKVASKSALSTEFLKTIVSTLLEKNKKLSFSKVERVQTISSGKNDFMEKNDSLILNGNLNVPHVTTEAENNLSGNNEVGDNNSNDDDDDGDTLDSMRRSRRKRKRNLQKFSDYETCLSDFAKRRKKYSESNVTLGDKSNKKVTYFYTYKSLRDRNKESSRRSRLHQKLREIELHKEVIFLESQNIKLLSEVNRIECLIEKYNTLLMKLSQKENLPRKLYTDKNKLPSNLVSVLPDHRKSNNAIITTLRSKQNVEPQRVFRSLSESVHRSNTSLVPRNTIMTISTNSEELNRNNECLRSGFNESKNYSTSIQIAREKQVAHMSQVKIPEVVFHNDNRNMSIEYNNVYESSSDENKAIEDSPFQEICDGEDDDEEEEENMSCDMNSDKANCDYFDEIISINSVNGGDKSEKINKEGEKTNLSNNLWLQNCVNDSERTIYVSSRDDELETTSDDETGNNNVFCHRKILVNNNQDNGCEKFCENRPETYLSKNSDKFHYRMKNVDKNICNLESSDILKNRNYESVEGEVDFRNRNSKSFVSKLDSDFNKNVILSENLPPKQIQGNSNIKMVSILRCNKKEPQEICISSDDESSVVIASDVDDDDNTSNSNSLDGPNVTNSEDFREQRFEIDTSLEDLFKKEMALKCEKQKLLNKMREVQGRFVKDLCSISIDLNPSQLTNDKTLNSIAVLKSRARSEINRKRNILSSKRFRWRSTMFALNVELKHVILEKENRELKKKVQDLEKCILKIHSALLSIIIKNK